MADSDRNRLGPFVITGERNLHPAGSIICAMCGKVLATLDPAKDQHDPSCEQLLRDGAVPVPNFGWFCCQECGNTYQEKNSVRFQRNASGEISYY